MTQLPRDKLEELFGEVPNEKKNTKSNVVTADDSKKQTIIVLELKRWQNLCKFFFLKFFKLFFLAIMLSRFNEADRANLPKWILTMNEENLDVDALIAVSLFTPTEEEVRLFSQFFNFYRFLFFVNIPILFLPI